MKTLIILLLITTLTALSTNDNTQELIVGKEYIINYQVSPSITKGYNYAHNTEVVLNKDQKVKLKSLSEEFAEIEVNEIRYWIHKWYLSDEKVDVYNEKKIEYILEPVQPRPIPSEQSQFTINATLESGTIAIVLAEYEEWYCIDVLRYAEPLLVNYWVKKNEVGIIPKELIREGRIKENAELLNLESVRLRGQHIKSYIKIELHDEEYYMFTALGGMMGLVKKEDFIPILKYEDIYLINH